MTEHLIPRRNKDNTCKLRLCNTWTFSPSLSLSLSPPHPYYQNKNIAFFPKLNFSQLNSSHHFSHFSAYCQIIFFHLLTNSSSSLFDPQLEMMLKFAYSQNKILYTLSWYLFFSVLSFSLNCIERIICTSSPSLHPLNPKDKLEPPLKEDTYQIHQPFQSRNICSQHCLPRKLLLSLFSSYLCLFHGFPSPSVQWRHSHYISILFMHQYSHSLVFFSFTFFKGFNNHRRSLSC